MNPVNRDEHCVFRPADEVIGRVSWACAAALLVATGLHSWPVTHLPALRLFWPATIIVLGWLAWLMVLIVRRPQVRESVGMLLPPMSIWAYLAICVLSVAAAPSAMRSATVVMKIAIALIGTYALIRAAADNPARRRMLPFLGAVTASGVLAHAAMQVIAGQPATALFESPLKLGCFLTMAVPFAGVGLVAHRHPACKLWGVLLVVAALLLCESVWAWLGVLLAIVVVMQGSARRWLIGALLAAAVAASAVQLQRGALPVVIDAQWREADGSDVRQRYLEWQALLNLLKERGAAGTGSGCLNEFRSQYYYRLPKNNTIAAFDQNGYLATAAELGIPGLIAFCWLLGEYLRRGWYGRRDPVVRAAWAGLMGGAVAQIGTSLTFNGILVVFAILLGLIDSEPKRGDHASA